MFYIIICLLNGFNIFKRFLLDYLNMLIKLKVKLRGDVRIFLFVKSLWIIIFLSLFYSKFKI